MNECTVVIFRLIDVFESRDKDSYIFCLHPGDLSNFDGVSIGGYSSGTEEEVKQFQKIMDDSEEISKDEFLQAVRDGASVIFCDSICDE